MGWWRFTRSALDALIEPPADTGACDRAVGDLLRESRAGAAWDAAGGTVRKAWGDSRARVVTRAIERSLTPEPAARTIRLRGWIVVVVGATVLAMDALKPVPLGPLSSVVPLLAIGAGVLLILMAAPVARASADRLSRH